MRETRSAVLGWNDSTRVAVRGGFPDDVDGKALVLVVGRHVRRDLAKRKLARRPLNLKLVVSQAKMHVARPNLN